MPHPSIAFLAPGGGELIVVLLALLLLFGPKDAPRILRHIQGLFHKLQRTAADFRSQLLSSEPPRAEPHTNRSPPLDEMRSDASPPAPPPPYDGSPP